MGDPVAADGSPTWPASSANFPYRRRYGRQYGSGCARATPGYNDLVGSAQLGRYLAEYSPDRDADFDAPMEVTGSYVEGLSRWSVTASRPALLTS